MAAKGSQNKKVAAVEAGVVLASVKDLDLTKVVNQIGTLQVNINTSIAGLSATLTSKVRMVEEIDAAISLKEARLEELFNIEASTASLDDVKAQREIEDQEWSRRVLDRDAKWRAEEQERDKLWARSNEEHEYEFAQKRKRVLDDIDAEVVVNKRNEAIRKDMLEREWNDREVEIASKETEISNLRILVDGFDTRIRTEVSKNEAIVTNALKRQYDHEMALLKKDAESQDQLNKSRIENLNVSIVSLQSQIETLQNQLISARADAKDVATRALDSASDLRVSIALQKAMDTQSQGAKKQ